MPPATGRFRPFPRLQTWVKTAKRKARPYDFDLLKKQYLDQPSYEWVGFCKYWNYNPRFSPEIIFSHQPFQFRDWKRDWLKHHAKIQDEEIGPELLSLRKAITVKRVGFVHDWAARSQYMKVLLDATLRAHGEALQHDERNKALIAQKQIEPKFKINSEEMNQLASAAARIQDIEMRALLIVSGNQSQTLPQLTTLQDESYGDSKKAAEDSKPEFIVNTMGQSGLTASESARLLAEWFDQIPQQQQKPKEEEVLPDAGD